MLALRVRHPKGKGRKNHRWRRGKLFSQPCHVTAELLVGAALWVEVHSWAVQLEDRSRGSRGHTEASLEMLGELARRVRPSFWWLVFSGHIGARA